MIQADALAARITADGWAVTAKVVAGKYPEWRRVLPAAAADEATISRVPFLEALGRAALASGDDHAVKVTLADGKARFAARNELSEAATETGRCSIPGGASAEFVFDPKLLKAALDTIDDDDFTLDFCADGRTPVKLGCSTPSWLAVIMPMQTGKGRK